MNDTFTPPLIPSSTDLVLTLAFISLISILTVGGLLWLLQRQRVQAALLAAQQLARHTAEQKLHEQQTGLQLIEAQLRDSQARFSQLLEDMRQAVILFECGRCIAANRAALAMFRLQRLDQMLNRSVLDFSPVQQPDGQHSAEKINEMMWIATELGSNVFEWEWVRANGESFVARMLLSTNQQKEKQLIHAVLHDITEQKMVRKDVEFLAFYDGLTLLPNRIWAREQLNRTLASDAIKKTGLAVVLIRLYQLSAINGAYGEYIGDHLLLSVAMRLAQVVRPQDLLSRRAGDGFMVVLTEIESYTTVSRLCDQIMQSCVDPFGIENTQIFCGLVLGVSLAPRDGEDADTLIRHANLALAQATKIGANSSYFFEAQMLLTAERYASMRDALRHAFEQQTFVPQYQPFFSLSSDHLLGFSVQPFWLLNQHWQPLVGEWLETASTSGLLVQLGRWLLNTVCQQMHEWHQMGHEIDIRIALSLTQCRGARAERDVLSALQHSQIPPHRLQLELPADLMHMHDEAATAMLKRFSDLGIQLCLSDCTNHWINLLYLQNIGIKKIVIYPKNHHSNISENQHKWKTWFQATHELHLSTCVCEVTEEEMATEWYALGCTEAQGSIWCSFLNTAACTDWLQASAHKFQVRGTSLAEVTHLPPAPEVAAAV